IDLAYILYCFKDGNMNSLEIPLQEKYVIKKKICVLGGVENYKDEFQREFSSNILPIENKRNIGVNISKIDCPYQNGENFEFLLWNIDCRQSRAYLRTIFYKGAEAVIIFISEAKVDQVLQYFNEVQGRLSSITLVFCIILEKSTKDEIIIKYFSNKEFDSMIKSNSIQIEDINDSSEVLNQICSISLKRSTNKELENIYIIDFIPLDLLFAHSDIQDECNDYFEPESHGEIFKQIINTEQLASYLLKLKLNVQFESINWLKFKNNKYGTFSIYLKNGNVYLFPKICEKCKKIKCLKLKKAPFFICIEAGESMGWTNIDGFDQPEILILAKILALIEGNENNLPRSILNQIRNINYCDKGKK
ncbi:MAG: hypothetical protein JSV62_01775, partial [Promethearchaeota archaeon]